MRREVAAELEVEITAPTTLEFQIAIAPHPNTSVSEALSFNLDGANVQPLEISGVHGNRIHKLDVPVGLLKVEYSAAIVGRTDPAPVTEYDLSMYLRPSRYAEADKGWTDRDAARWPVPYWDIDTGMASLMMLLTAVDAGLGACFFGMPVDAIEPFRKEFGVPAGFAPIGAISVGFSDEPPRSSRSRRRPIGDVVFRGNWGSAD